MAQCNGSIFPTNSLGLIASRTAAATCAPAILKVSVFEKLSGFRLFLQFRMSTWSCVRVEELKFSAKMSASPFLDPLFFFGDFDAEECGGAWYSGRRRRRSRRAWRLYRSSFFKDFERAGSVPALEDDDDGPFALAGPTATLHRERERERERELSRSSHVLYLFHKMTYATHTHTSRERNHSRASRWDAAYAPRVAPSQSPESSRAASSAYTEVSRRVRRERVLFEPCVYTSQTDSCDGREELSVVVVVVVVVVQSERKKRPSLPNSNRKKA